jgi:hypothetical protein
MPAQTASGRRCPIARRTDFQPLAGGTFIAFYVRPWATCGPTGTVFSVTTGFLINGVRRRCATEHSQERIAAPIGVVDRLVGIGHGVCQPA